MNRRFRIFATIALLGTTTGITSAQATETFSIAPGNGLASSIGAGPDNPWVVGYPGGADMNIFEFTGSGWAQKPGAAKQVAVSPDGVPWVVTTAGYIYSWNGQNWTVEPGCARSIGVGPNNDAWIIECGTGADGNIFQFDGSTWFQAPGTASQIAVSPEGIPWVITSQGLIYQWIGANWTAKPGCAKSIGIGPQNDAWVIGCASGDSTVYHFSDSSWVAQAGAGVQISASTTAVPWVITAAGTIYKGNCSGPQEDAGCTESEAGVPPGHPLPIPPVAQEESNWCWAATAQMILGFYGVQVTQCQEASDMVRRQNPPAQDCCAAANKSDAACNHTSGPHIDWYGLGSSDTGGPALSWNALSSQLQSRPVAFDWNWTAGGGHWMVAVGTKTISGVSYVTMNDPGDGEQSDITYARYVSDTDHTTGDNVYNIIPADNVIPANF